MNIISWNLNSVTAKYQHLQILIDDQNPIVICLQETKLKPTKTFTLKQYDIYRHDQISNQNAKGGVAIAVQKNVRSQVFQINSNLQAVAVTVFLPQPITICSIYLHQDDHITCGAIEDLANQLPTPYILTGDFNAHNCIWGSSHTLTSEETKLKDS